MYGAHIFHTNDLNIWKWINQFSDFIPYKHTLKVKYNNEIFSFPINLLTLNKVFGVKTPEEAKLLIESEKLDIKNPSNLEEWVLSKVGEKIYKIFIEGYTIKQWTTHPSLLPSSIIKRIPIRFNFDDSYFSDRFQGIPSDGYTKIFENIFKDIEVMTNTDYFKNKDYFNSISKKIVYTGKIDEFFDYRYGKLDYRSLLFEHIKIDTEDFQGCSVMNYTSINTPYTRICEHKHFEKSNSNVTWITKEYPKDYTIGDIPYYPINNEQNNQLYKKYKNLANDYENVIFGGRLAEYRYYDMHQVIESALNFTKQLIK
jgi:UDP-galactopyranose mutase